MNLKLCSELLQHLHDSGLREIIICPGSFNSPIIAQAQRSGLFNIEYHYDESVACFYALGKIKVTKNPVAVCVTSGTAVAECLSAIIEAKYTGLPLIVLSADRAERFVGTGAPQVLEQLDVLKSFVQLQQDLASLVPSKERIFQKLPLNGPSHFNLRFEEPLFSATKSSESDITPEYQKEFSANITKSKCPLVILGEIPSTKKDLVTKFLTNLGAPIIAEPLSGLREESQLKDFVLRGGTYSIAPNSFDLVIRIGSVPVTVLWRDLERLKEYQNIPALVVSEMSYTGMARECKKYDFDVLENSIPTIAKWPELRTLDNRISSGLNGLCEKFPLSELAIVNSLSKAVSKNSNVYLGNSLPIREWADFGSYEDKNLTYYANRGQNGINGQISTYAGVHEANKENWALLGDLTFLYDINSLGLVLTAPGKSRLVILNNHGGQIFQRLPYFPKQFTGKSAEDFINGQNVNFRSLAEAFGLPYLKTAGVLPNKLPDKIVIEVIVNVEETNLAYQALSELKN
jgi:2-succinyl-5-enolpyruvyl-6-hydroxy-3-cyclohexene-1-carboxylate synthase